MQLITLITDYGHKDTYLAELKLGIYNKCNGVRILDVCHEIDINEITAAAFHLKNILPHLPPRSINLVAVNNHYVDVPKYLVFTHEDKFFLGPDNGIFSLVMEDIRHIYQIDREKCNGKSANDIYSHAIACIHHGLDFMEFCQPILEMDRKIAFRPVVNSSQIRASIIHVDSFGNVITNISKELFDKARNSRLFSIYFKPNEPLHHISKSYGDVGAGEVVCFFNQSELLEIAVNAGNASDVLNLYKNETIQIDFHE